MFLNYNKNIVTKTEMKFQILTKVLSNTVKVFDK